MSDYHHQQRQTKIVATLGPSSDSRETIEALFKTGVDVFRLNFSHGTHDDKRRIAKIIRDIEADYGQPIAILADLQGPKLRLGKFTDGSAIFTTGDSIRFDSDPTPGNSGRVCLPHPEILSTLTEDNQIFLDDGKVRVQVTKTGNDSHGPYIEGQIIAGTKLSDHKGFNLPDVVVPVPALTEKDREDLPVALEIGADWIAQSFVQQPEDVEELLDLVHRRAAVMVKLEKPSALEHLDELIDLADGFMLARGDLGVEIPPQDVPSVQKQVVRRVHASGKPIIVATQMLESMIDNPRPTRAEASDVATAVYDGADGVMLSAETAAGSYPLQAVKIMDRVCRRTEDDEIYTHMMEAVRDDISASTGGNPSEAITTAAFYVAQDIGASVIVTHTKSGSTALRTAKQRPIIPILCLTPDEKAARRLVMSYGVCPVIMPEDESEFTGPARQAAKIIRERGFAESGDQFVMTAGVPFGVTGSTNLLRIAEVE